MTIYRLDNQRANYKGYWLANTAYLLGDRVLAESTNAEVPRKYVFECTTAGTSQNPGPPTWDVSVPDTSTTTDGTVTWTCRIPDDWDNAHGRLDWLTLLSTAGDFIYVDDGHSSSHTANITIQGSTTFGTPLQIICVDKATDLVSTGALISNTAAIYLQGVAYSYGVNYTCTVLWIYQSGIDATWTIENSTLDLDNTSYVTLLGLPGIKSLILNNVIINIGTLGAYISSYEGYPIVWNGGSLVAAAGLTNLFKSIAAASVPLRYIVRDVDLSAVTGALVNVTGYLVDVLFERCKLGAGTTIITGTFTIPKSGRVRAHHCSNANNVIEFYEACYEGTVEDETTIVRSGGLATSWKMVSSANVKEYIQPLISPPFSIWNSATGSAKTITVYIYNATADLDDDEVWIEVEYPANDGGKGLIVFDRAGCGAGFNTRNPLATPAAQADDTSTWNGSSTYSQKLQVTFTPALAGPITVRVHLAKASTTMYVDPKVYIT